MLRDPTDGEMRMYIALSMGAGVGDAEVYESLADGMKAGVLKKFLTGALESSGSSLKNWGIVGGPDSPPKLELLVTTPANMDNFWEDVDSDALLPVLRRLVSRHVVDVHVLAQEVQWLEGGVVMSTSLAPGPSQKSVGNSRSAMTPLIRAKCDYLKTHLNTVSRSVRSRVRLNADLTEYADFLSIPSIGC